MKNNSRLAANLLAAFVAGSKKDFTSAVSGLGVEQASKILVHHLLAEATCLSSLRGSSSHLLDPSALRAIPGADNYVRFLLLELNTAWKGVSNIRMFEVVKLLLPYIKAGHLTDIEPLRLGPEAASLIAAAVPYLPKPGVWILAASLFRDPSILTSVIPYLSSAARFDLWMDLPQGSEFEYFEFLIENNVCPDTDDDKKIVISSLIQFERNQADLVELLRQAWPGALATFQILPAPPQRHPFWTAKALLLLLDSGASLDRENWIGTVFCTDPFYMIKEIDVLSGSALFDWNLPNRDGHGFLTEVRLAMADAKAKQRFPILEKLLNVGADPTPLMADIWQKMLSVDEIGLLTAAAKARKARLNALALPSRSGIQDMEVEVDLL